MMSEKQTVSTVGNSKEKNEFKKKYNKANKKNVVIKKVVKVKLTPEKKKLKKRMGTSEHVHGTLKRADDASYFLTRGKEKVNAELALSYCDINLRRLINLVPFDKLMECLDKGGAQKGLLYS